MTWGCTRGVGKIPDSIFWKKRVYPGGAPLGHHWGHSSYHPSRTHSPLAPFPDRMVSTKSGQTQLHLGSGIWPILFLYFGNFWPKTESRWQSHVWLWPNLIRIQTRTTLSRYPPYDYSNFRVRRRTKNPCFLGGFPRLFPNKQGKQDRGWLPNIVRGFLAQTPGTSPSNPLRLPRPQGSIWHRFNTDSTLIRCRFPGLTPFRCQIGLWGEGEADSRVGSGGLCLIILNILPN